MDNVLGTQPLPEILARFAGRSPDKKATLLSAIATGSLLVALLHHGLTVLQSYVTTSFEQRMILDFRSDRFEHAQRLSMGFHDQSRAGELIYAINFPADAAAGKLDIPLRGTLGGIAFDGGFYGHGPRGTPYHEGITIGNLLAMLRQLPHGTTELSCHPGEDRALRSCYCVERLIETATLCDPRVRVALGEMHIALFSFADLQP